MVKCSARTIVILQEHDMEDWGLQAASLVLFAELAWSPGDITQVHGPQICTSHHPEGCGKSKETASVLLQSLLTSTPSDRMPTVGIRRPCG